MKKILKLKLIESNDTPKIGDIIKDVQNRIGTIKSHNEEYNAYLVTYIVNGGVNIFTMFVGELKLIKPILISDEEIKVGDNYLLIPESEIRVCKNHILSSRDYKKIEVTSEQLPINILEAIVEGKLKDGDSVEVDCHNYGLELPLLDSNNKAICSIPEESNGYVDSLFNSKSQVDSNFKEVSKIMYSEEEVINLMKDLNYQINQTSGGLALGNASLIQWFNHNKKK